MKLKVGDRVVHESIEGTVVEVRSEVLVCRDFNGTKYWDSEDYWEPISEEE